jgi:hypothetical protein
MEEQQLSQQDHLKEKIRIELEFVRTGVINHSDIRRRTGVNTGGGNELVVPGFGMILCSAAINCSLRAFIKLIKRLY